MRKKINDDTFVLFCAVFDYSIIPIAVIGLGVAAIVEAMTTLPLADIIVTWLTFSAFAPGIIAAAVTTAWIVTSWRQSRKGKSE